MYMNVIYWSFFGEDMKWQHKVACSCSPLTHDAWNCHPRKRSDFCGSQHHRWRAGATTTTTWRLCGAQALSVAISLENIISSTDRDRRSQNFSQYQVLNLQYQVTAILKNCDFFLFFCQNFAKKCRKVWQVQIIGWKNNKSQSFQNFFGKISPK